MKYEEIRKKVLERIRPTPDEERELRETIRGFVTRLAEAAKQLELDVEPFPGGSTAKGTHLRGDYDVDLFMRFHPRYDDEQVSELLEDILRAAGLFAERVHGSRDYFQIKHKKCTFEIVPVCRIDDSEKARNVTDMSPLHVTFAKARLARNPQLRDDIRLAKQFCKAARIYGAESYIGGFSGHVLDLLSIHYGGFREVLSAAASWTDEKVVIDVEKHHKNPLKALNESKLYSPLIIVDPVQPERNAAAALTHEKYRAFIEAAIGFLERPSLKAFTVSSLSIPVIKKKADPQRLVIIEIRVLDGKKDVVGAKCQKVVDYLEVHIKKAGFTLLERDWDYDHDEKRALAYYIVKEAILPKTFETTGPPLFAKQDAKKFRDKHDAVGHPIIERNNRLYATITRSERTIRAAVKKLLVEQYVTSRVGRIVLK